MDLIDFKAASDFEECFCEKLSSNFVTNIKQACDILS